MYKLLLFLASSFCFTGCLKEDVNPAAGIPNAVASAEVVRSIYKGTPVTITPDKLMQATRLNGVVISDVAAGNIPAGNLVVQSYGRGNVRGITIAFGAGATVPCQLGDSVSIEIINGTLGMQNGTLQISGITPDKITTLASGIRPVVKQLTLAELSAGFAIYEGTLVRLNADITPVPVGGDTYKGSKRLFDGADSSIVLYTDANASFAAARVPASAQFTGIATSAGEGSNVVKQLRMRNSDDVKNASGPLYPGYPEDFESPDLTMKASYNITATNNNIDLKTGNWKLYQAILANTAGRDRFNPAGKQCIRLQQNLSEAAYVQMNYDLPYGATKVSLSYGAYYTDASSTWKLEYSTDGGVTWVQTGPVISDAGPGSKVATFLLNISGPVRFRVNKPGLGTTNGTSILNGRLSIEDIAIYQN